MGSDLITVALGSRLGLWVNHHGLSSYFVRQEPEGTQTVEVQVGGTRGRVEEGLWRQRLREDMTHSTSVVKGYYDTLHQRR